MNGTARALRAPSQPVWRTRLAEQVTSTIWFIPTVFTVTAFVASRVTLHIDERYGLDAPPRFLMPGGGEAAVTVTATVAAGMLTFLGVVFSTTLIALQLAGSQYSPRIVRVFVRSRLTQVTLGVFLATFVFSLDALIGVGSGPRGRVPAVTVSTTYVLMLTTVGLFIAFLHGIVRLLRVQYLLRLTARS